MKDPQIHKILNIAMQLLNTVQNDITVESLPKEFWVTLGMVYEAYQTEMSRLKEESQDQPTAPGAVVFEQNNTDVESKPPTTIPANINQNLG